MKPIEINGAYYYTCEDFAKLIHKDLNTVFTLLTRGNTIRQLKSISIGGKPLIDATEYTKYPFTLRGPNSRFRVYHYTKDGIMQPCAECSAAGGDTHGCV